MRSAFSGRRMLVVATLAVGAAILMGLKVAGSPALQRRQRLDSLRVEDLTAIRRMIASYTDVHKKLPADLASLSYEPGYSVRIQDPESHAPYGYEILGADTYRICAVFSTRRPDDDSIEPFSSTSWAHGIGRQCFSQRVDLPRARLAPGRGPPLYLHPDWVVAVISGTQQPGGSGDFEPRAGRFGRPVDLPLRAADLPGRSASS